MLGYATLGAITKRLMDGDAADVAMVSPGQERGAAEARQATSSSRVEIARVGFTVFVKKGASKPDVSSVDALTRTLLTAQSIALGDPAAGGGAGVYTAGLMKRLGIAAEIMAKTKRMPSGTEIAELLPEARPKSE